MPKFEKQFIYFMWDDKLKGKECFVADNISNLKSAFERDYRETIIGTHDEAFPFEIEEDAYYRFAYYDKNYDVKKAYEEGEVIQYKAKDTGRWCDWNDSLGKCTFADGVEYRIKPEPDGYVVLAQTDGTPNLVVVGEEGETRHVYFHGTLDKCLDYINSHNKFASIMKAWEDGKTIQFKNYDEWLDVVGDPEWVGDNDYRVKPEESKLEWTDLSIGDIIERISGPTRKAMVTDIDEGSEGNDMHVYAGCVWFTDEDLENWRKV